MMNHPHFRLKVDLSKFFHDARQCSWIFVDGTKIQQIMHLKQHISILFNITKPFHLLLNNTEYLPPAEDVRLLKDNETVLVVPGSGINNHIVHKVELSNDSLNDKEIQICDIKIKNDVFNKLDGANNILNTQQVSTNNTRDITFYSVIDEDIDRTMLDDTEQDTDSKVADNLIEDCNGTESVVSIAKRKRVRKRRSKNRSSLVSPSDMKEEDKSKKPKIIDSYIIPTAKHIRFDSNIDSKEDNIAKHIVQETSTNESYMSRASSTKDLSMLLSLGQSSTPITFVNKIKHNIKMDTAPNNRINKNLNKIIEEDISLENKLCNEEANKKPQCSKSFNVDIIEKVPIMTRKPQIKDIIAFKTLKIAADYTPQISNFIVTEVLDLCEKTATYTLKILHGREEVQVPFGKFSLSDDDESTSQPANADTDMFLLNYAQMKELRLI